MDCGAISAVIDLSLSADVLIDAEEGEAEAHEEKAREQVRCEERRKGNGQFQRALRRHQIVDEGDAHHVEQAATKHGLTARTSRPGFEAGGVDATLGQRLVTVRAISVRAIRFRDSLAAKWTFSSDHLHSGRASQENVKGALCKQGRVSIKKNQEVLGKTVCQEQTARLTSL